MSNFRNVVRSYSPESLAGVGRDFEGLFDQLFGPTATPKTRCNGNAASVQAFRSPTHVWEKDDLLHIEVELPGVQRDAVSVTFEKGDIHIKASRPAPDLGEHKHLHNTRSYGEFQQRVSVGENFNPDTIQATLSDGVLHLSVAKQPASQPRQIEIR